MAIAASGAVSLSDIQNEFGGTNPISMSEYYSVAEGIPASEEISISDFYGASVGVVTMSNITVNDITDVSPAEAIINYNSNGSISTSPGSTGNQWFSSIVTGIGVNYEIYVSRTDGTVPSGTLNTWLSLSSNQQWSISDTTPSVAAVSSIIQVSIRDAATQTVQDTATVTLFANYFDSGE